MDSYRIDVLLFVCPICFLLSSRTILVSTHWLEKCHLLNRDLPCHIHWICLFCLFTKLVSCILVCACLKICHCEVHVLVVVAIDLS